ncbi:metal ABC transporter solute-binding protein, Zn/Mn family [Oikeobacillus pervagus]|nr:zinc ABC transporter substrate-binding protein [Oikeobacillus pervagus]
MKWLLITILIFTMSACGQNNGEKKENENGPLSIYTTVYPLQDFTQKIGDKYVDVHTIYPPGADEHTFEPSQKDMMALAEADLFFYIGLGLEGFVDKAKNTLKAENVQMVATANQLDEKELLANTGEEEHDHHHSDIDPHVWIDPIYAQSLATAIKDTLVKKMPKHSAVFEKNYEKLIADLDKLNDQFEAMAQNAKINQVIVSHAAYGYWEKRYGIEQIAIQGISSSSEPSQKDLKQLIEEAKKTNTKTILFEQNVSSKLTKVVQNEIGAKPLTIHNLSVLTKKDIDDQMDYFSLMKKNIHTLDEALNP